MRNHTVGRAVLISALAALIALLMAAPAGASHKDDPRTKNLHPLGHIEEPRSLLDPAIANPNVHTDIAFWGKYAFQGSWLGFNIRDISAPGNPKHVSSVICTGAQGDVVVWDNILVRSWDGGVDFGAPEGAMCGGDPVPEGFAGLHIFDVSDVTAPVLVGSVELSFQVPENEGKSCGSHTATGVPDLANNRLLVYNNPSTFECEWFDVVEIPLDAPEDATFLRRVETGRPCHDTGVILGDAMLAACAGGNGFTVFSLDPAVGGSLDDPAFLISVDVNDDITDDGEVAIGHSAGFTWDGEVLIFGHEPGGGVQAMCQEDTPDSMKSAFFYEARTGEFLGMWTLPRPQSEIENCTFHNFNIVPLRTGKYIMVSGNYQAGVSVVDFTDPANAVEIAWSDPEPLGVIPETPFCDGLGCEIGGSWSAYWYNGFIYDTNITKGLHIFRFSGPETAGAIRLPHLNPQTQEFTIP
jgi:hypothetical protein